MFGRFRKNEKRFPVENVGAHELGRRTAESANADIEAYMQRFYPGIRDIGDAVFGDFESTDIPPFVLARIDLKNFLERVDDHLRPNVLPQLRSAMAGWVNVAKQAGAGAEMERLIDIITIS